MLHLIKDGQPTATCPFCGESLDGSVINGLHERCSERFSEEIGDVFPESSEWEALDEEYRRHERHEAERMLHDLIEQVEAAF